MLAPRGGLPALAGGGTVYGKQITLYEFLLCTSVLGFWQCSMLNVRYGEYRRSPAIVFRSVLAFSSATVFFSVGSFRYVTPAGKRKVREEVVPSRASHRHL
eukprot:274325-Prorocentrum_minimum.AAC.1